MVDDRRRGRDRRNVGVILGTERVVDGAAVDHSARHQRDGTIAGFQDKVQIDPSEDTIYAAGSASVAFFTAGPLTFGIAICHEGWRYPETVRWAARQRRAGGVSSALSRGRAGQLSAVEFADPANTFHEKAIAVPRRREHLLFRDGELRGRWVADHVGGGESRRDAAHVPAVRSRGLLIADLDLGAATGVLAKRSKYCD